MEKTITWEQFEETYKPIQNHITHREEYNGWLFETYDEDLLFIHQQNGINPLTIWTILESDEYKVMIGSGYHHINRMGYIVTEIPFDENESISVVDEDDKEDEPADA